jgi:hypothetical protein
MLSEDLNLRPLAPCIAFLPSHTHHFFTRSGILFFCIHLWTLTCVFIWYTKKVNNYKSYIFHRALQLRYQVVKNICWRCVGDQIIGTSRPKSQENQFSPLSFAYGRMHWNKLGSLTKNPTLCSIVVVPELTAITYITHLSIVSHPYMDKQCIITCYILK